MNKRDFDLIIYGASGFTGRLVAEYLQAEYGGSDLKWAMAGRSAKKLAMVRDEMGISNDIPIIAADATDADSLAAMAQQAKVIITTVGPYQTYGEPLVKACVVAGTDYVDLSGEPLWMKDMIVKYDAPAKESGARIVHSCGFDSVPFDLGVFYTQEAAKIEFGAPCREIRGRVRKMKGTFSGGTAASFKETMVRVMKDPSQLAALKDPFSLSGEFNGPHQPAGHKVTYEDDLKSWAAPFIMAAINTKNIHRSNALMGHAYGEDFLYSEMILTGDGEQGEAVANHVATDDSMAKNPPKPGEGPSKEERETGFYDVLYVGQTADGQTIMTSVSGDKDPGYGSTCKMIAESAICLARDVDRSETGGGVLTPAPAMGNKLIARLMEHAGLTFKRES
ncbi:MAG: saccharopine dehydrogenase NADP-binding domain-containing protein [Maricaulaceae bacterium]